MTSRSQTFRAARWLSTLAVAIAIGSSCHHQGSAAGDFDATVEPPTSEVAPTSGTDHRSILVLDLSDEIYARGAGGEVIDGALAYVDAVDGVAHQVAIVAFGSSSNTQLVQSFTSDPQALTASLEALRDAAPRGPGNLYGAYVFAIDTVANAQSRAASVERHVVLVTDSSSHDSAGARLRGEAIDAKRGTHASVATVVFGDGETSLAELASDPRGFIRLEHAAQIGPALATLAVSS